MCITTDGLVTNKRLINLQKSVEITGNVLSSQPQNYLAAIFRSILCVVSIIFVVMNPPPFDEKRESSYFATLCFCTIVSYVVYLIIVITFSFCMRGADVLYAIASLLIQCVAATSFQLIISGLYFDCLPVTYIILMALIIIELYLSLIQMNYIIGSALIVVYNVIYILLFVFVIDAASFTASFYIKYIIYCIVWHLLLTYLKNYVLFQWFTSSKISTNVNKLNLLNSDNDIDDDEYCKIVMGSCTDQKFKTLAIYQALHREYADVVLLLGDNIYADLSPPTLTKLKTKCCRVNTKDIFKEEYELLVNHKDFRPKAYDFSEQLWLACWDDHDYGENDAAKDYSEKVPSKRAFIEFLESIHSSNQLDEQLAVIKDDDNRGLYYSYNYNYNELNLKVIMLDTRFDREADDSDIVGDEQWQWLKQEMNEDESKTDIDIDWYLVCNGSPILNEGKGGKKTVGQQTRDKLFAILNQNDGKLLTKTILLSGDLHYSVWHSWNEQVYELTASSMTHSKQWFCPKFQYKYLEIDEYTMAKENNGNGATHKAASHCRKNSFGILNINKNKFHFCVKDSFGYSYINVLHQKK